MRVSLLSGVSSPNTTVANPGASGGDVGGSCRVMERQFAGEKGFGGGWGSKLSIWHNKNSVITKKTVLSND